MSDVTEEMLKERDEAANFFQQAYQTKKDAYKPYQDDKRADEAIEELMSVNRMQTNDWTTGPRNFFDHTKNSETKLNFMGQYCLKTTGEYRVIFQGKDRHEAMKANDAAFRAMALAHKDELAAVWDAHERTVLEKQHQLERTYVEYRAGKDEGTLSPRQEEGMKTRLVEAYKDYEATQQPVETQESLQQSQKRPEAPAQAAQVENGVHQVNQLSDLPRASLAAEALAERLNRSMVQNQILKMRQKSGMSLKM